MRSVADFKMDQALAAGRIYLNWDGTISYNIDCASIWKAKTVEELPITVFELLYKQLGIEFQIRAGKITGISFNFNVTPKG